MRSRSNSYGKKKKKVNEEDFCVLHPYEHVEFLNYDYNVKQLKSILKTYGLKISGNKNELTNRVYNYMRNSYFCVMIQKTYRTHLMKKFYNIKQKTRYQSDKEYNNTTDFFTMEDISKIPQIHLYSYTDQDGFNFIFRISSLFLHFESKQNANPYNRQPFLEHVVEEIKFIKKIHCMYSCLSDEETENVPDVLSRSQKIRLELTDLFHIIDTLGNYSDMNWLLNLSRRMVVKFIKELYDIWEYRAQLTMESKRQICPPNGNPFQSVVIQTLTRFQEAEYLLEVCISILNKLLKCNTSDSNKSLGALYILSALTIVSPDAADALPWLYASVSTQH